MDRRFERTRLLLGDAALKRLHHARVTVVGLGAVGSYAVEGLARAGVGYLRLVDFDRVEITNINRQLYALESTLGQPKALLAAARVRDIHPACEVEPLEIFVNQATVAQVLEPAPDLVVDAIDSLNAKATLLAACVRAGVPVLSSMGAARHTDPSHIRVADISETSICPLARFVRKRLHKRGIHHGVRCIFSTELVPGMPASAEPAPPENSEAHAVPGGRARRPMGSLSTMTGIMGLIAAREAIMWLALPKEKRPDWTTSVLNS